VSASVDKLMCVFHTVGNINDDKGMDSVSVNFHTTVQLLYMSFYQQPLCNIHNLFESSFWLHQDTLEEKLE
jgi:hypothetical protein